MADVKKTSTKLAQKSEIGSFVTFSFRKQCRNGKLHLEVELIFLRKTMIAIKARNKATNNEQKS